MYVMLCVKVPSDTLPLSGVAASMVQHSSSRVSPVGATENLVLSGGRPFENSDANLPGV